MYVAWAVFFTDNLNKVTTASPDRVTATFGSACPVVTLAMIHSAAALVGGLTALRNTVVPRPCRSS